jgi:hypothetical protein
MNAVAVGGRQIMKHRLKFATKKITGSWPRLTLSALILLSVLLVCFNGLELIAVLNPPVAGQSEEVKLASHKWRRLQKEFSTAATGVVEAVDLDLDLLKATVESELPVPKVASVVPKTQKPAHIKRIKLPILSGILRSTDIHGNSSAFAIIDGKRFKENDRVKGFRIQKIQDDGVVISREERKWILEAPDVQYSHIDAVGHGDKSSTP